MNVLISAPDGSELSTSFPAYYQSYLKEYQGHDLLKDLMEQSNTTQKFLFSVPAEKEKYRYATGKWSLREVAGHVSDTERILSYRALRIARGDKTPLPGFDENEYAFQSNYHSRPLKGIAEEMLTIRNASISLFLNMNEDMFKQTGVSNNNPVSVKALLYCIIAHQVHHLNVISERYLASFN